MRRGSTFDVKTVFVDFFAVVAVTAEIAVLDGWLVSIWVYFFLLFWRLVRKAVRVVQLNTFSLAKIIFSSKFLITSRKPVLEVRSTLAVSCLTWDKFSSKFLPPNLNRDREWSNVLSASFAGKFRFFSEPNSRIAFGR